MDTISPTSVADMKSAIPKAATGRAAQLRAQSLAVTEGQNPEKLTIPGRKVLSAGSIPVGLIQHGSSTSQPYPRTDRAWSSRGRRPAQITRGVRPQQLRMAENSEHNTYADQPAFAVQATQRVTTQAANAK